MPFIFPEEKMAVLMGLCALLTAAEQQRHGVAALRGQTDNWASLLQKDKG